MFSTKQIHDWKEFKFDRNECDTLTGESVFSEKENLILDGIGEFIESQIENYPNNKFKHYDILQECILASLRHYKKKNRSYKNPKYIEFFMFEILDKTVGNMEQQYLRSLPEFATSTFPTKPSFYPPSHKLDRE